MIVCFEVMAPGSAGTKVGKCDSVVCKPKKLNVTIHNICIAIGNREEQATNLCGYFERRGP